MKGKLDERSDWHCGIVSDGNRVNNFWMGGLKMAYVNPNYKTKKEFKQAVANGIQHRPYNPSGMFPVEQNGRISIEGPHYPKPHTWYADCDIVNGIITKVR